jgi:DNA-binding HxlR family transcriptional regulator
MTAVVSLVLRAVSYAFRRLSTVAYFPVNLCLARPAIDHSAVKSAWWPVGLLLVLCHFVSLNRSWAIYLTSSLATRKAKHSSRDPRSPAFEAVKRIGMECRLVIIRSLLDGPLRFSDLLKVGVGIERKTLSRVLKYLESEEIVRRVVLGTRPLAVEYSLTEKGMELKAVIDSLQAWGEKWIPSSC